jgi:hypothetical protein
MYKACRIKNCPERRVLEILQQMTELLASLHDLEGIPFKGQKYDSSSLLT